jgi:thiol-disulfide isomerase/thioredoxin
VEKKIKVIEFSGESCANCYSLLPVLNEIMKPYDDCILEHIEIREEDMDIVEKYDIDRVPTILILKNDVEIGRCRGYQPEEILAIWLDDKIEQARRK